jgi:glycosyltransferase involved in cell wall biosynthesis
MSRLAPVKGHIHLIRAMPRVLARLPEARLEIAGDGPERPLLDREIARLGLTAYVTLLGWQADVRSCLERWSVLAHPSLDEGFGIALLEAVMFGIPVVASEVGGIPELIGNQIGGRLVPAGTPEKLADALVAALVDWPRSVEMAVAARTASIDRFAPGLFAEGIRDVIRDLSSRASR